MHELSDVDCRSLRAATMGAKETKAQINGNIVNDRMLEIRENRANFEGEKRQR
jgi:hypothetical protein